MRRLTFAERLGVCSCLHFAPVLPQHETAWFGGGLMGCQFAAKSAYRLPAVGSIARHARHRGRHGNRTENPVRLIGKTGRVEERGQWLI